MKIRIRISFLLLLLSLGLGAQTAIIHESEYADTIRVACIGNSVTFGYGIQERERNSYPARLQEILGEKYEVRNFGFNGATLLQKGHKNPKSSLIRGIISGVSPGCKSKGYPLRPEPSR